MVGRRFGWSSHFRPRSGRKHKRPQPALRHRLRRFGDLRNIDRQHLHGMVHRNGRTGNSGRGNQIGQRCVLLHDERAWLNNSLPSADVVFIGYHNLLRRKLRISLLRTRPTRRLRLCFLGIHRRQIFRDFVMHYRLVRRRLRQDLRLVQPCQIQRINRQQSPAHGPGMTAARPSMPPDDAPAHPASIRRERSLPRPAEELCGINRRYYA